MKRSGNLSWWFAWVALLFAMLPAGAQPQPSEALREASRLHIERKYPEALKVLQAWLTEHPDDPEALFDYGYTLYLQAAAEGNSAAGDALRKTAREYFVKAQKKGSTNVLLEMSLSGIDENGKKVGDQFSANPKVDALMKQGEVAFAGGRFDEAFSLYQKALAIDPRSYSAALFCGDAFFSQDKLDEAIKWFDEAIKINPNLETAHRYKGDALRKKGRAKDSLDEYIEAVIAEPANRIPREMLRKLAAASNRPMHHPQLDLPIFAVEMKESKKIELHYDPKYGAAAMGYAIARSKWLTDERSKYFSADAKPRHSLPEEIYGLRSFATLWQELEQSKPDKDNARWAAGVAELKKIDEAGLLEAYVLLDRSDAGIVQDYEGYRLEHRDLLSRYIREIWMRL